MIRVFRDGAQIGYLTKGVDGRYTAYTMLEKPIGTFSSQDIAEYELMTFWQNREENSILKRIGI